MSLVLPARYSRYPDFKDRGSIFNYITLKIEFPSVKVSPLPLLLDAGHPLDVDVGRGAPPLLGPETGVARLAAPTHQS